MERDEVYVSKTRSDLGIPKKSRDEIDWDEYFGESPIYTMYMLVRQQLLAFPAYLCESQCSDGIRRVHAAVSMERLRSEEVSEVDKSFSS